MTLGTGLAIGGGLLAVTGATVGGVLYFRSEAKAEAERREEQLRRQMAEERAALQAAANNGRQQQQAPQQQQPDLFGLINGGLGLLRGLGVLPG